MTVEEQLYYCKKCNNRRMDLSIGITCGLTGEKPSFQNTCENFDLDKRVEELEEENADPIERDGFSRLSAKKLEQLMEEQNFSAGVVGSVLVGLLGAGLWAAITIATTWQIGYMAVAIGAGVGYTMQYLGKGIEQKFGIAGAIIAVISCVLGNFLSVMGFLAVQEELGYLETLFLFDYSYTPVLMSETFQLMDLLFYGIAGYEGYKFAFRKLTQKEAFL